MKKLCSIILAAAITFISVKVPQYSFDTVNAETESTVSVWNGNADTSWFDSEDDEMYISSAAELAGLSVLSNKSNLDFKGKTIYLTTDIDLAGKSWMPISVFNGTFEGQHHIIRGLNLKETPNKRDFGLFACLSGIVKNIEILDCNISLNCEKTTYNYSNVGLVCGVLTNGGIYNCKTSGTLYVRDGGECRISGICAQLGGNSIIDSCVNKCNIQNYHLNSGKAISGGITALSTDNSQIINSYNTGNVNSTGGYARINDSSDEMKHFAYSGGIVGIASKDIQIRNCYNVGKIEAQAANTYYLAIIHIGSIVADLNGGNSPENTYYLTSTADKGIGLCTVEDKTIAKSSTNMKKESFALALGEAFAYKEDSYPVLKWELNNEAITTTTTTTTTATTTTATPTTTTTTSTTPTTTTSLSTTTSTVLTTISSTTLTSTSTTQKTTTITTTTANEEFKLEVTSITIKNGDQYTIPINRADIVFKSTNPDVAVVSPKGIVTAIGTGEAIINVIDKDYNVIQLKVRVQSDVVYSLGDVNNDGQINAVDASTVLSYYAMISTNKDGGFDDKQKGAADVNKDGLINAVDASCILSYYAYTSTTKDTTKKTLEEFLKS